MSIIATKVQACHVTTASGVSAAGVFASIRGIVAHLGRRGHLDVQLLHAERDAAVGGHDWSIPHVTLRPWAYRGPEFFCYGPGLGALLPSQSAAVVHQHGLWQYHSIACAARQRTHGVRRVVSPHGMLHPWAVHVRPQRKRAAWIAYERRSAATADAFHATAHAEATFIRDWGLRQPIAVIPHGVDVPEHLPDRVDGTCRTALFVSRLHPGKRVEDLLAAWSRVKPRQWKLVIAGPDHDGHRASLESLARALGVDDGVRFSGPVYGAEKDRLFRDANLFILPSLSENFGLVVAEALASGVPVITTTGTPWNQLPSQGCGWWIPPGSESLAEVLREAVAMDAGALANMGRRGWEYARADLTWDRVARQYEALYDWLVGGGAVPSFVET